MILSAEEMRVKKFGKLRMKDPKVISHGSDKKETWICDCGKETIIQPNYVILGHTKSCGRCNEIPAEEMKIRKFGKLRIKDPKSILPGSKKKEMWVCDCGKEKLILPNDVISEKTTSCGRCNEISAEEMKIRKFGKLRMKDPKAILPGSKKKEIFICDCGKEITTKIYYAISGKTVSCGRCNEISAEEMLYKKFGRLRIKYPKIMLLRSGKREIWICDCGKEMIASPNSVTSGKIKSCGNCFGSIHDWYLKNKELLQSLKCPIDPKFFPFGGPVPLEIIKNVHKHKFKCAICGDIYYPRFSGIKSGTSLTCGCSSYRISSIQKDISLFIESLGFFTELEYEVNRLKYDIFVSDKNLLIEYDGFRWHSMKGSKERDLRKEENALDHGYEFLRITEEEWTKNRKRVENQLKNMIVI